MLGSNCESVCCWLADTLRYFRQHISSVLFCVVQESVAYAAELSDSDDEEVGQVLGAEDLIYGAGGPHKTPLLEQ